jgi:hypothetical protein
VIPEILLFQEWHNGKEMEASTSYPDGNWGNEKNCTWLYSEKPTHGSGLAGHNCDYIGRFFLHFTITIL